ncbi:hypothetical protein MYCO108962_18345 [Mycobacterium colombiense]
MDSAEAFNTSGTYPVTIPGTVCASGRTRLLTGNSNTTSELETSHPPTSSAHAAAITDERRTPNACDNSWIPATVTGSNSTGGDDSYGSRSSAAGANR